MDSRKASYIYSDSFYFLIVVFKLSVDVISSNIKIHK